MKFQKLEVRGLQYHVHEWGDAGSPKLFMLHGWMDCGATFGYMMEDLAKHFHVFAPDLRGFGDTDHAQGGYWFPDYFADLDVILNTLAPAGKVDLVGHSMGGNIVYMYAGIRPERVGRVLSLEGIGLPPSNSGDAAQKYQKWIREVTSPEQARVYPNSNMLKHSIYKGNPSLPDQIIEDLADLWGKPVGDDGAYTLKHDQRHRHTNPVRYNQDDTREIWRNVTAKAGLVMATSSMHYKRFGINGRIDEIKQDLRIHPDDYFEIHDCDHMLHLEKPKETAAVILKFFGRL